jgi:Rrf2 family protein
MRISKKAEYALRALAAIARQPGKSWPIQELASGENIPIKFLEQILLSLRRGGILSSKRGVGGGYTMLRPAAEISFGEVISIFDGPCTPVACSAEKQGEPCSCPDRQTCPLRLVMKNVRSAMTELFESVTVETMLRSGTGAESFDI